MLAARAVPLHGTALLSKSSVHRSIYQQISMHRLLMYLRSLLEPLFEVPGLSWPRACSAFRGSRMSIYNGSALLHTDLKRILASQVWSGSGCAPRQCATYDAPIDLEDFEQGKPCERLGRAGLNAHTSPPGQSTRSACVARSNRQTLSRTRYGGDGTNTNVMP